MLWVLVPAGGYWCWLVVGAQQCMLVHVSECYHPQVCAFSRVVHRKFSALESLLLRQYVVVV